MATFSNLITRLINKPQPLAKVFTYCIAMGLLGLLVSCNNSDRATSVSDQKLMGTWAFQNADGSKSGTAIFEPKSEVNGNIEGNIYLLTNDLATGRTAIAGKYRINAGNSPPQLDLVFEDLTTRTIYEIDRDGKLKIANALPEQNRPNNIDEQAQQLTKISESTVLDKDIKVLKSQDLLNASALVRQTESKSYIRAILRSQQQIFQEKGQFSNELTQVTSGLKLNTDFYNYTINLSTNNPVELMVQNNAIPLKDGLKAYTGIVYAIANESNEKATKALICESNTTTKELPSTPKKLEQEYICPDGYTSTN
ncbi:type IV pilin-like G/H family protein [Pseudanabaena sp. FACHB-1998]|uniref:type IV pilin-like G/H family protein n=1 Tax=Pseudanabaena sp. FACHB-1998 TaxID=2692858 RepID=UPI0016814167|nr:type IV pilin-like G/H family protein [Pseudanabaena sp. FACHB-1998]MBD2175751.1 type IV pilin-like G/H family protein [Pseudanabaena sp. FACHB-1998]